MRDCRSISPPEDVLLETLSRALRKPLWTHPCPSNSTRLVLKLILQSTIKLRRRRGGSVPRKTTKMYSSREAMKHCVPPSLNQSMCLNPAFRHQCSTTRLLEYASI